MVQSQTVFIECCRAYARTAVAAEVFLFPLYHSNKAVKNFDVLVALAVYDRALSNLDVVDQFLDDFPVKLLQIQIAADKTRPLMDIFDFLPDFLFLGQKDLQPGS